MEKYLRMVFKTDQDKKVSIRVSVPRDDLDATEVKTVMDLIVAKNIVSSISGDLIAVDRAYLVETSTTELEVTQEI
ncbi:DUF2922 domain-containing protein [Alkaliphilus sp. B6464]|uniref:DUF2922 domain-containing protein n=1 Tax=Alkaliphilus sp. B6464 TaxID=2731219 RepID=UPI001BA9B693|nr:DUF2922 domain-containing protein [Alkaliphilus sp. B6464]QUH21245.1 DUF2922 domain-containing protein [Alkaliphilus sp. B6464]